MRVGEAPQNGFGELLLGWEKESAVGGGVLDKEQRIKKRKVYHKKVTGVIYNYTNWGVETIYYWGRPSR